jgi:HTH-type transcriptional repressor of NAD biosynthesis genes
VTSADYDTRFLECVELVQRLLMLDTPEIRDGDQQK